MNDRVLIQGNEAVGWGALHAGCRAFFGYPITPQNEITEWFAREFPPRGLVFVQSQSESGSIQMLYGAASTGTRALTSTSSPGWGLMQEGMSCLANAELPCVVVLVMRGGPGQGTTRHAQMDYHSVTRGGGGGGYKNITLAPWSVQEKYEFTQLAFHLADKWRNPVILLSDGLLGQMVEILEYKNLEFDPLPKKDWAVRGRNHQDNGARRGVIWGQGFIPSPQYPTYLAFIEKFSEKLESMKQSEQRFETYQVEDAKYILVSYGSSARISLGAVEMARAQGIKAGLIRVITPWPFPYGIIREYAGKGVTFLAVEDSQGQMVDDVQFAVAERAPVHFLGMLARHEAKEMGMIFAEKILEKLKTL